MLKSKPVGSTIIDHGLPSSHPRDSLRQPSRIESLEQVRRYIDAIDFQLLKQKNCGPEFGGLGWQRHKLDYVERQYRNWLFLRRMYEGQLLPPPADVDDFWHAHILETRSYHRDSIAIFGCYLHHDPYVGFGDPRAFERLRIAFERTQKIYRELYGTEIVSFDETAEGGADCENH